MWLGSVPKDDHNPLDYPTGAVRRRASSTTAAAARASAAISGHSAAGAAAYTAVPTGAASRVPLVAAPV